jgi:Tol biopolymer transport system component/tRNA A-37 threonylcarbamoyl transferase component Bud32
VVGRTIAHYTVLEKLGEGGMGVVYKARDTRLGRLVAIKTLPPNRVLDDARKQRFIQEAKAASALNHPNIVHIYDIDETDGIDFISMEFVVGKTLDRLIPRRGMPLGEALKYGVQITDALAAAHKAGIVHRDLKPGNVMIGEQQTCKVLDFGLAKLTEAAPVEDDSTRTLGSPVTEEGTIVGTVAYMSPEQSEGKRVDARSDIFSFGSMFYEMLTGRRVFQRDTTPSTLAAIQHEDPKPASEITREIPGEVDRILKRCLRKDPAERFQHMDDLKVALQEMKQESDSGSLKVPAGMPKTRRRPVFPIAAAFVVLLALALGALWFMRARPDAQPVPVPLTSYPGTEDDPSFSPDGTQVAFTWCKDAVGKECNVYIKQIGIEPPSKLTGLPAHEYSSAWSPDGRFIAFLRTIAPTRAALIIVPQRGGRERVLAEIERIDTLGLFEGTFLAWTPDSKWIAVSEVANTIHLLVLHSVETGERRKLTSPATEGEIGDLNPAFSPDGQTLAFTRESRRRDIYLLRLDEGYRPQGVPERLGLNSTDNVGPVWIPGGREIVFLSGLWGSMGLWRAAVGKSVSPQRLTFAGRNVRAAAVSHRSDRLAYSSETSDANIWRIDLHGPDGKSSPPTQFISSTRWDHQPAYSPDGKRIAFISDRSGDPQLWVCDNDGSNHAQLTSLAGRLIVGPMWSWDSRSIAFYVSQEGKPPQSFAISASGGEPRRIESLPSGGKWPYWSRDGTSVYFAADLNGGVWKVALSGGRPVQIARTGDVPQESPDGKYVYYHKGWPNPMSIWRVGTDGGQETKILESVHTFGAWTVAKNGIYFIRTPDQNGHSDLCIYDFATGLTRTLTTITSGIDWTISASPDGKSVLYSQIDVAGRDLMLVENFR